MAVFSNLFFKQKKIELHFELLKVDYRVGFWFLIWEMSGKKRKATIINNNNKKQKLSESGQSAIQSPYDTTTTITTASNETNSRNNLNDQDAISEDFENERQEQNLESLDIFGKARYALQLSTIPSKLPGREKQKEEIEFVVRESILNGKSRAMSKN